MSEFRRSKRVPRHIIFEGGHPLAGLEMRVHGLSVGEWLEWTIGDMVDAFADRLIEWNWVDADTGEPVPTTKDGVLALDAADLRTVMAEWRQRVTGIHRGPLGQEPVSTNGSNPIEATLSMGPPIGD